MTDNGNILAMIGVFFAGLAVLLVARLADEAIREVDRRRRAAQPRVRTRCRMGRRP